MRRQRSDGFTLVELLVVIAIIGILVALLLPAVQAAREAARRMQCSNNMKQIGLSLHNYHDTYKKFPMGQMIWNPNLPMAGLQGTVRLFGWQVGLLPFMEQNTLYDTVNFQAFPQINTSHAAGFGSQYIETYLCPSNPFRIGVDWTGGCNPRARSCQEDTTPTHYSGIADHLSEFHSGGSGWPTAQGRGMFYIASDLSFRDVLDGTGNTIFIAENVAPDSTGANRFSGKCWAGWNLLDVHNGVNFPFKLVPRLSHSAWNSSNGPASFHPGGCMVTLGDGSVRFLAQTINQPTLSAMATRAGGEALMDTN